MALNVAVVIFNEVEVLDFAGPFEIFGVAGRERGEAPFHVYTVAESAHTIAARNNLLVTPNYTLDDCPPPDIVVIPGGAGSRVAMHSERLLAWVKQQAERVELMTSVCTGARVLAAAGLLDGLKATTYHSDIDELAKLAPNTEWHRDVRWVDNGTIITSAGVQAGMDMALHVIARLLGTDAARETAVYIEYEWNETNIIRLID
jgi:transcriptional regulator GlxA family with amidase domain